MANPDLNGTYGAVLIGLLFATFFQGMLSVQAYVYYESFPNDNWKTKSLVAAIWCMDLLHLVLISQATYHYLVTNWGNPEVLVLSTVEFNLHLAIVGVATIMCQSFFLNRIWLFGNKNKLLVASLAFLCLTTFVLSIALTVHNIQNPVVAEFIAWIPEVIALFTVGAATDIIMALLLCYYLRRGRSEFEKTNSIIALAIRYTITTGLSTSMLALACVIAYLASPNTFIFIAMHFSLGRLYTNALLATLNSRRALRNAATESTIHRSTAVKPISTFGPRSSTSPYKPGHMSLQLDTSFQGVAASSQASSPAKRSFKGSNEIELHPVRPDDEYKYPLAV